MNSGRRLAPYLEQEPLYTTGAYGSTSFGGSEGRSAHPGRAHQPRCLTYGRSYGAGRSAPVPFTVQGVVTHRWTTSKSTAPSSHSGISPSG